MRLFSLSITACLISSKNRGLSIRKNKVRGRKGFAFSTGGVTEREGTIDWFSGGETFIIGLFPLSPLLWSGVLSERKTLPFPRQRPRFSANGHSIKVQEAFPPRLGRNTFSISLTALRRIIYPWLSRNNFRHTYRNTVPGGELLTKVNYAPDQTPKGRS
ncbi:hypothetical protein CDAR_250311 [Caerostris darwini]|uniref:Uncharacterized protein n=1 Tax=Caerostris darwini TaxID=1538125 RepID=A0AAV4QFV3_9ARAC|nr:hypothetical protein CDAR_250311 [Caerostris darwini]